MRHSTLSEIAMTHRAELTFRCLKCDALAIYRFLPAGPVLTPVVKLYRRCYRGRICAHCAKNFCVNCSQPMSEHALVGNSYKCLFDATEGINYVNYWARHPYRLPPEGQVYSE